MIDETKKAAAVQLAGLVSQINRLVSEAERLADQHELDFNLDIAYGMGGYYDGTEGEWNPSSQSC